MTTVAKKPRGLRQRIAELLVDWIYPELQAKDQAVKAAALWEPTPKTKPCINCRVEIPEHAAYCSDCGVWQEEDQELSLETKPLYSVKLGGEHLYFQQSPTGNLQINGMRPRDAYVKKWRQMIDDADKWLR